MALLQHDTNLPPAQPSYVLRGHDAQIHSVCFMRQNTRLVTGDADGWLILWNLVSKRPVAVWRAHAGAILGLASWNSDKLITHGRDGRLRVWQLRESDESLFSGVLPVEDSVSERPQPWVLHSLIVNTINFCSFSACEVPPLIASRLWGDDSNTALLVAVTGASDSDIDIHSLPANRKLFSVQAPKNIKTGMIMCSKIFFHEDQLVLIAGYENGNSCLWRYGDTKSHWKLISSSKIHSQPILSLDVALSLDRYYTSAADAVVAAHPLTDTTSQALKQIGTKHSGQQSLKVRSDNKIFATAGWDGRIRVYSAKTMRELAVLKWHKQGCYGLSFADMIPHEVISNGEDKLSEERQLTTTLTPQTVEEKRNLKVQATHWLAAGSKDGKVSLWDIY